MKTRKNKPKIEIEFEVSEPRSVPHNSPVTPRLFKIKQQLDQQIEHAIYQLEIMQESQCKK